MFPNTVTLALFAVGSLFSPVGDPLLELMRASKGKMALAQWETRKEDYTYRGWPFPEDLKLSASQLAFAEAKVKEFKDYRAYHLLCTFRENLSYPTSQAPKFRRSPLDGPMQRASPQNKPIAAIRPISAQVQGSEGQRLA